MTTLRLISESSVMDMVLTMDDRNIYITYTNEPKRIGRWLWEVTRPMNHVVHRCYGLDVEWVMEGKQRSKVCTVQLCFDDKVLIFQPINMPLIYKCIHQFFACRKNSYFGVAVGEDIRKLSVDYGIQVKGKHFDLSQLVANELQDESLRGRGLKLLADKIANLKLSKSWHDAVSNWSSNLLNSRQIKYAALDAYASFKIYHDLVKVEIERIDSSDEEIQRDEDNDTE